MNSSDYYFVQSVKLQDWLEEQGVLPDKVQGKTAYYLYTLEFEMLLDKYFIETVIF